MHRTARLALALLTLAIPVLADPVDGSTADWGTVANHPADSRLLTYDFAPGVASFVEDTAERYYVEPGYGGQDFDVEALFLRQEGWLLRGGLLTGFDLATGELQPGSSTRRYAPGDLLLDLGSDGGYDFALDLSSYAGGAVDLVALAGDNSDLAPVVFGRHWIANPWRWDAVLGGSVTGAVVAYLGPALGLAGDHQIFEFALDLSALGNVDWFDPGALTAHWTMECGNDYANVDFQLSQPTPEPGTFVLLGSTLLAAGYLRRRRRRA